MAEIPVRPPEDRDLEAWSALFRGYMAFYEVPENPATVATLWAWIHDPQHVMQALVAVDEADRPIGLAHFHAMPRSLGGNTVCYLSDLFTDPAVRGRGIGRALIDAVIGRCRQEG
ncbi:Acetyltransferase (GNAT) family protein [Tistlia consotensis]|uniref:Acetyltransferase (GNAT) family protein n=1 Tax=Tistlia consotensis USBA 355 TaxID=560819 RepID=A0A1Y6CT00_9PROT|nr:GNAT family N-acetyltransferase [Tistlia consotensis]SMF77196.1 Acetyltransferase (GNAT) family protein [Tistlia consotensis USBA 355]SNS14395.1 Acetyltransferase (GNAT) family protein [Tistlia consotensis]